MGKKKNKKLKKILRAQVLAEARNAEPAESTQASPDQPQISKKEAEIAQISEDKKEVRHEIKKILITVAVLILIIVAVDLINNRTDIILKTGQFLADKLNLNI